MIAFASMLLEPAAAAEMRIPTGTYETIDELDFDPSEYPHFYVFCATQLGRPMKMDGEQFRNAKIIAKIPEEHIKEVTLMELIHMGLEYQT